MNRSDNVFKNTKENEKIMEKDKITGVNKITKYDELQLTNQVFISTEVNLENNFKNKKSLDELSTEALSILGISKEKIQKNRLRELKGLLSIIKLNYKSADLETTNRLIEKIDRNKDVYLDELSADDNLELQAIMATLHKDLTEHKLDLLLGIEPVSIMHTDIRQKSLVK